MISPDFVATVVNEIMSYPSVAQINFSGFYKRTQDFHAEGLSTFVNAIDSYPNLNYISANVYRTDLFRPLVHVGHRFGYTLSPHIAMTISCVANGGVVRFATAQTVDRGEVELEQQWNWTTFCIAQGLLVEHPDLDDRTRPVFARKIERSAKVLEKTTMNLLLQSQESRQYETQRYLYDQFVARWFYFSDVLTRIKIIFYRLLFYAPRLSITMVFLVLRCVGKKHKIPAGEGQEVVARVPDGELPYKITRGKYLVCKLRGRTLKNSQTFDWHFGFSTFARGVISQWD
jgi:hypothetical protein